MIFSKLARARSIARRLFLSAALWIVAVLSGAGVLLSAYYRSSAVTAFDERLRVYLRALVQDVATGEDLSSDGGSLGDPQFGIILSGWYWQITRLDASRQEIHASRSLYAGRLPKLADIGIAADIGGARAGDAPGPAGAPLRIVERTVSAGDNGVYLIQVGAVTSDRDDQIMRFEVALAVTFVLLAAGLLASTALQVSYGLAPLNRLQEEIAKIRSGEQEKISAVYPIEITPIVDELNQLIDVNRGVVERARTQVGNLAHALKTPLSVIHNELASQESPVADKIRTQSALMRDQLDYYLNRARAAARASAIGARTPVAPALEGLVRTFRKLYPDTLIDVDSQTNEEAAFLGEGQDFDELVGNLLDNACKWARGRLWLNAGIEDAQSGRYWLVLTIEDDGPGLDADLLQEAMRRGRRLDETKPGSGLGLSIVADLAAAYGGSLELAASSRGGLLARLKLPAWTA